MLDLADLKETIKKFGDKLRWAPANRTLAGAMTKHLPEPDVLLQCLKDLQYGFYPEQGSGNPRGNIDV